MPLRDLNNSLEHEKFLEEIRRRAEEAELARIEAEELKLNAQLSPEHATTSHMADEDSHREVLQATNQSGQRGDVIEQKEHQRDEPQNEIFLLEPGHSDFATRKSLPDHVDPVIEDAEPSPSAFEYRSESDGREEWNPKANSDPAPVVGPVEKPPLLRIPSSPASGAGEAEQGENTTPSEFHKGALQSADVCETESRRPQEPIAPVPSTGESRRSRRRGKTRRIVSAIFLFLLGLAAFYVGFTRIRERLLPSSTRILILPDRASTADAYITEGLVEMLITELSHIPSLEVIQPASTTALHAENGLLSSRGFALDHVLHLKVDRDGPATSFTVVIMDGGSSQKQYERHFLFSSGDLPQFAGVVVPYIAGTLGTEMKSRHTGTSISVPAFDDYLRGRNALRYAETIGLDSAAAAFRRSCGTDSAFAEAEVALGWTLVLQYEAALVPSKQKLLVAEEHLLRAASLGAQSSELHRLWGAVEYYNNDNASAIQHLTRAITMAHSDALAHQQLALAYLRDLKADEGKHAAEVAVALDPLNARTHQLYAIMLMFNGDNAEAVEQFEEATRNRSDSRPVISDEHLAALVAVNDQQRALDVSRERAMKRPDDFVALYDLGRTLQLFGKPIRQWEDTLRRSQHMIRVVLKTDPRNALAYAYLGLVETRLGNFDEGIAYGQRALAEAHGSTEIQYLVARIYALQRDKITEGFRQLASASRARFLPSPLLDLDFLNLRSDPEFLRKILQ